MRSTDDDDDDATASANALASFSVLYDAVISGTFDSTLLMSNCRPFWLAVDEHTNLCDLCH